MIAPALPQGGVLLLRNQDMDQRDLAALALRRERQDEDRVRVAPPPIAAPPGLDDPSVGDHLQIPAGDVPVPGAEAAPDLAADRRPSAGGGGVLLRVEVELEE